MRIVPFTPPLVRIWILQRVANTLPLSFFLFLFVEKARVYFRLLLYLRIRADYCQRREWFGSEDTPLGMRGDKKDKRGVFVSRRCRLV